MKAYSTNGRNVMSVVSLLCCSALFLQTHEEFRQVMNGYKPRQQRKTKGSLFMEPNFLAAPPAVDWREKGYVTPVKDQVCPTVFPLRHLPAAFHR